MATSAQFSWSRHGVHAVAWLALGSPRYLLTAADALVNAAATPEHGPAHDVTRALSRKGSLAFYTNTAEIRMLGQHGWQGGAGGACSPGAALAAELRVRRGHLSRAVSAEHDGAAAAVGAVEVGPGLVRVVVVRRRDLVRPADLPVQPGLGVACTTSKAERHMSGDDTSVSVGARLGWRRTHPWS